MDSVIHVRELAKSKMSLGLLWCDSPKWVEKIIVQTIKDTIQVCADEASRNSDDPSNAILKLIDMVDK